MHAGRRVAGLSQSWGCLPLTWKDSTSRYSDLNRLVIKPCRPCKYTMYGSSLRRIGHIVTRCKPCSCIMYGLSLHCMDLKATPCKPCNYTMYGLSLHRIGLIYIRPVALVTTPCMACHCTTLFPVLLHPHSFHQSSSLVHDVFLCFSVAHQETEARI